MNSVASPRSQSKARIRSLDICAGWYVSRQRRCHSAGARQRFREVERGEALALLEGMTAAFYLLLAIGCLGAFDVLYFHIGKCDLQSRAESQREVLWHTCRHFIYALQFLWVANLRPHGAALLALPLLYGSDVFVAWADVWEETKSRKSLGGLPRGEYFMHVVLSVLVGVYL